MEKAKQKIIRRTVYTLVTGVHAKFGTSAIKIERSKHPKCEAPNEGGLLIKFICA